MSDHKFNETVDALFNGMNSFLTSKTVVGEPIKVGETMLIPLVDVSFGAGAGAWANTNKNSAAGGVNGKISPTAVMVVKKDTVRIMPVSSSDPISKLIDMAPDLINKITGKNEEDPEVDAAVEDIAEKGEKYE